MMNPKINASLASGKARTLLMILAMTISGLCLGQPTAQQVAAEMTIGWNLGNSLEVPGGETVWGNPMTTQQMVDAVADAGFNTLRIPCAWDSYANQSTLQIDPTWLARVKEVVDYGMNNDMYVIINSHWDNGWLEEHPFYANQAAVNQKQNTYWTQIAQYFESYDEHLLFAGTNEVRADYGTPTSEHIEVQESYNQTFVTAVRATGGNNTNRILIVQTYNTNAWHGLNYFSLPTDPTTDRLMVEIHYYDPYSFTLDQNSGIYTWDQASWGKEDYVDDLFSQLYQKWPNQGIPIILGEYGVMKRTSLSEPAYSNHVTSREYWLEYITNASVTNNIIPIYWDNGYAGNNGHALFNRNNGTVLDQGAVNALMEGAGNPGDSEYTINTQVNGSGAVSINPTGPYIPGTSVTLTATPTNGWSFSSWSGDVTEMDNPLQLNVNRNLDLIANFSPLGTGSGTILREYWLELSGTYISDLTGATNFPDAPSGSTQLTSLEGPIDWNNNYGTRIRGYLHAPASGTYTFWLAGDDNSELYISSDDSPDNKTLVASIDGWTNSREWNKYPSQQATLSLTEGTSYYIEVLHKEGFGGDNIAVAWEGPGILQSVIDGSYLSPYEDDNESNQYTISTTTVGNGSITLSPSGNSYDAGSMVTATANASNGWTFGNWSGAINGNTNPVTFSINSNLTLNALFIEDDPGGDVCSNPTTINLPFTYDGPGEYCWVTPSPITYFNSWGLDELLINGEDYTNQWSDSPPPAMGGEWVIQYSGAETWSHFEAHNSSGRLADLTLPNVSNINQNIIYPNPFGDAFTIKMNDDLAIKSVFIRDISGRTIQFFDFNEGKDQVTLGHDLAPGIYLVEIYSANNRAIHRILKQ